MRNAFDYDSAIDREVRNIVRAITAHHIDNERAEEVAKDTLRRWLHLAPAHYIPSTESASGCAFLIFAHHRVRKGAFRTHSIMVLTPDQKLELYKTRLKDQPKGYNIRLDALAHKLKNWGPQRGNIQAALGLQTPLEPELEDEANLLTQNDGGLYTYRGYRQEFIRMGNTGDSVTMTGVKWLRQSLGKRNQTSNPKTLRKHHIDEVLPQGNIVSSMRRIERYGRHKAIAGFTSEMNQEALAACLEGRRLDFESYNWIMGASSDKGLSYRASAIATYSVFARKLTRSPEDAAGLRIDAGDPVPVTILKEYEDELQSYRPRLMSIFHGVRSNTLPNALTKELRWIVPFLDSLQGAIPPQSNAEWSHMLKIKPEVEDFTRLAKIPLLPRIREAWFNAGMTPGYFYHHSRYQKPTGDTESKHDCYTGIRDFSARIMERLILPRMYQLADEYGYKNVRLGYLFTSDHDEPELREKLMDRVFSHITMRKILQYNRDWHTYITLFKAQMNNLGVPADIDWPAPFEEYKGVEHVLIVPANSSEKLGRTGTVMSHCAADFSGECLYEGMHIFNCYLLSSSGERNQSTLAIVERGKSWGNRMSFEFHEHAGYENTPPHPKLEAAVDQMIRELSDGKTIPVDWDALKDERKRIIKEKCSDRDIRIGYDPLDRRSFEEAFRIFVHYLHDSDQKMTAEEWCQKRGIDDVILEYLDAHYTIPSGARHSALTRDKVTGMLRPMSGDIRSANMMRAMGFE